MAQCVKMTYSNWTHHPCTRNGKYEHEGKAYCKIHHPPSIAEKNAARDKRWEEERRAADKARLNAAYETVAEDLGVTVKQLKATPDIKPDEEVSDDE